MAVGYPECMTTTESNARPRVLLAIGVALSVIGPALGVLGLLAGMAQSFQTIEAEPVPTPAMLAKPIEFTVIASSVGLAIGVIGLALVAVAVLRRPRARDSDLRKTGVVV